MTKRLHIGLRVTNLAASRAFYTRLFGRPPTFERADYAKWMLDEPYANISLIERPGEPGLHHFGIQLESEAALARERQRLADAGVELVHENRLICGYQEQSKSWACDPQGVPIEHFYTFGLAPSDTFGQVTEDGPARAGLKAKALGEPPRAGSALAETVSVRAMTDADADAVLAIYQQGIDTGHATFQSGAPDWAGWCAGHLAECRLVAEAQGRVLGWAALSGVSSRCVYRGIAELGVYVASEARGRGVGLRLLQALIEAAERHGIWTLQAGIFPENRASVALHERAGFRVVGVREKLGLMEFGPLTGRWRDVLLLERRSRVVGVGPRAD